MTSTQVPQNRSLAKELWPGALLAAALAAIAFLIQRLPGVTILSPMIIAILLGVTFSSVFSVSDGMKPGLAFSSRKLLRLGIMLVGFQITFGQVVSVGLAGLAIVTLALISTFIFTKVVGRALGVDDKLTELIASGTAVCGVSAIVATNTVTRASDEDVAYSIAAITALGSIAMFLFPIFQSLLQLDPLSYGLWAGASLHEIAQVAGATMQVGKVEGDFGIITKLSRVVMLIPLVVGLGHLAQYRAKRQDAAGVPIPWFIVGFAALVAINSLIAIPGELRDWIAYLARYLLSVALAALGLQMVLRKVTEKGIRPLLLATIATLFITGLCFGLIANSF
jgi:uncharacterized integral membrane protein (TIGR00698 family)